MLKETLVIVCLFCHIRRTTKKEVAFVAMWQSWKWAKLIEWIFHSIISTISGKLLPFLCRYRHHHFISWSEIIAVKKFFFIPSFINELFTSTSRFYVSNLWTTLFSSSFFLVSSVDGYKLNIKPLWWWWWQRISFKNCYFHIIIIA